MLDQAPTVTLGAERLAAMLDGAADALRALARDPRTPHRPLGRWPRARRPRHPPQQ
jgi:hypothetical protein